MRLSHLALAVLVCFAWGLNAVAAKIGVTYIPPVFFTALRFIVVLACMVPWLKPVPGKWDVLIPAVFFMGGLHFALIFTGVKFSDASTMSIVNQIYVPISVLLAMVLLGEVGVVAALARHRGRVLGRRRLQPQRQRHLAPHGHPAARGGCRLDGDRHGAAAPAYGRQSLRGPGVDGRARRSVPAASQASCSKAARSSRYRPRRGRHGRRSPTP